MYLRFASSDTSLPENCSQVKEAPGARFSGEENDTNAVDGTDISYEGLDMEVDPTSVGIYDIPNAEDGSIQFSATSQAESIINFEFLKAAISGLTS